MIYLWPAESIDLASDDAPATTIPAAGAGASLDPLLCGAYSSRRLCVEIDKTAGTGDVTLSGPIELFLERGGTVRKIAELNGGADLVLSDALGHAELAEFVTLGDLLSYRCSSFTPADGRINLRVVSIKGG